jgi:hypothetical protein
MHHGCHNRAREKIPEACRSVKTGILARRGVGATLTGGRAFLEAVVGNAGASLCLLNQSGAETGISFTPLAETLDPLRVAYARQTLMSIVSAM